jgi:hypothetical protein
MEHRWNEIDRGKPKYSEKHLSQCHFVHHKSHMDGHLCNLGMGWGWGRDPKASEFTSPYFFHKNFVQRGFAQPGVASHSKSHVGRGITAFSLNSYSCSMAYVILLAVYFEKMYRFVDRTAGFYDIVICLSTTYFP